MIIGIAKLHHGPHTILTKIATRNEIANVVA